MRRIGVARVGHGAVDTTFVQFYPTLLPVAQQHTLSVAYMEDEAKRLLVP